MKRVHRFLIIFDAIGKRLDERFPNNKDPVLAAVFKDEDLDTYINLIEVV